MKENPVFIGSDHAGFGLKQTFLEKFKVQFNLQDIGCYSEQRCDYPDIANTLVSEILRSKGAKGVLVCGSGQGMAIRANRFSEVRAALCTSEEMAELARAHNDANILCLGARISTIDSAEKIFIKFMSSNFEGGRHLERVKKLGEIAKKP